MNSKKKVFVIHWWWEQSTEPWFVWLKNSLEQINFEVKIFDMPNTEEPKINTRVNFLKNNILNIDKNTYIVWHSIWCQTILRYLSTLDEDKKLWWIAFIADWFDLITWSYEEIDIAKPWIETPINFDKAKIHTDNFFAIFSDDDYYVSLDNEKIFREKINAKTVIETWKWHYSQKDGITEIPVLLERFKK